MREYIFLPPDTFSFLTAAATNQTDPPWLQYGLMGAIIFGILYLKVIVPGWVYQAELTRNTALEAKLAERDEEIKRLRDLAMSKMIPLLERTTAMIQRAEIAWTQHPPTPGQSPPGSPGSSTPPSVGQG